MAQLIKSLLLMKDYFKVNSQFGGKIGLENFLVRL
jgi:hypothetical protein